MVGTSPEEYGGLIYEIKPIADVNEDYILFRTGRSLSLSVATRWGWERLREYVLEQQLEASEQLARARRV